MSPSTVRTRAVVGAVVIAAIVAIGSLLSPSALLETLESVAADPFLFGVVVVGLYLVRPVLAVPTTPLAVVVGYGFGVVVGVPIALLGVVTTVIPVFLFVRWIVDADASGDGNGSAASFDGRFGSILERTGTAVTRYYVTAGPIRGVVASRLAPIPSDVATSAAATVSAVRLRHLVIGTAIGELPWTIAAVVVGASAATVTTEGLGDLGIELGLACLLAAIALLAGPAYRVIRTERRAQNAARPTEENA